MDNLVERIMETYDTICAALHEKDIEKAMGRFSNDQAMIKISNGKIIRGKKELKTYWEKIIKNANKINIKIKNISINKINEENIWVIASENIIIDGKEKNAIVSNIFKKEDDVWKILMDHTTYIQENG